jgi:hypothetical protein
MVTAVTALFAVITNYVRHRLIFFQKNVGQCRFAAATVIFATFTLSHPVVGHQRDNVRTTCSSGWLNMSLEKSLLVKKKRWDSGTAS